MLLDVDGKSLSTWRALGNEISFGIKREIESAPTGIAYSNLMAQQIGLITSIPTEAAERVHRLVTEGLTTSARAKTVAEEILRSGEVAKSRAILIARTETSRAATTFMQARAQAIGSTHYVWETSRDSSVRPGHRAMQGVVCEWANPPLVMEGDPPTRPMHFHPGTIWNCRCWPRPIFNLE